MAIEKGIRVHTCYNADLVEKPPDKCSCRKFVTRAVAEEFIGEGLATYLTGYDRPKLYTDLKQICMIGRRKRTPRASTIERPHLERAYLFGGDQEERLRIEEYGALTKATWDELIVFVDADEFDKQKELDYGISILYFPGNDGYRH